MKIMKLQPSVIRSTILLLTLLASFASWAFTLTASVNRTDISKDEVIQLKIVADKKLDSDELSFDNLSQDFYIGRPSFSSSMNIINSQRDDSSVWTIALAPQKLGTLVIPAFTIDGVSTQPITLRVTKDEKAPTTRDMLEVTAQLDQTELYPQQSTLLHSRIVVKVDPRMLQNPNLVLPVAHGLDIQPLDEAKQYQIVVDGIEVLVIQQTFRVQALQAGDYTIEAPTLSGGVLYGGQRNGSSRILTLSGEAPQLALKVLPIPQQYQGHWLPAESVDMQQTWQLDGQTVTGESIEMSSGDSLTRTVTIQIQGITEEQFPSITIDNPASMRVYNEKPSYQTHGDGSVSMTLKQVLIAKHAGEFTLPNVNLQWWNTQLKQQATTSVNGVQLLVKQGDSSVIPTATNDSVSRDNAPNPSSSIWPVLTALFALAWVFSTIMWYRAAHKHLPVSSAVPQDKYPYQQRLRDAVERDDVVAAKTAFHLWNKQVTLPSDIYQQIAAQLQQMEAALLAKQPKPWDKRNLLTLLKNNAIANTATTSDPLAKL